MGELEQLLLEACGEGNVMKVKKFLLEPNINLNEKDKYYQKFTPFALACCRGHIEIVKLFLEDQRTDINLENHVGSTAFWHACANRKLEIVKLMILNDRVDINKPDVYEATPLIVATYNRDIEIIKWILASYRHNSLENKASKGSALDIAKKKDLVEIVELFESFQSNPQQTRIELRKNIGLACKYLFEVHEFTKTN